MKAGFYPKTAHGYSASHIFCRWVIDREPQKWYVLGLHEFTTSGFAVIDDFGLLVEVPQ
jgi:hypothetical protein